MSHLHHAFHAACLLRGFWGGLFGWLVVTPSFCSVQMSSCLVRSPWPLLQLWVGVQALSLAASQERIMDKLRGRVRAGSRFSRAAYIPARMDEVPTPLVPGGGQPLHQGWVRHPRPRVSLESLLPLGPGPTVLLLDGRRETRRKENAEI